MQPPSPHSCTIKRKTITDHETIGTDATIATGVPCLFAPATSSLVLTFMGRLEQQSDLLFIPAGTDIKAQDLVQNEDTDEWWVLTEPPRLYQNPVTWEADHFQCVIERQPLQ